MSVDMIPENLNNWDLKTINQIIQYRDIESETLEFKEEINDLPRHICALANSSGGFLVFGIASKKDSLTKKILGYKKIGFDKGKEDEIGLEIGNNVFLISPIPSYKIKHISDDSVFYSILKIKNEIFKKPFFVKNKGQCHVRIDNSSRPAPRSTIMNLFGASIEHRKNIENLRSSCILLKASLFNTINYLKGISTKDQTRPAPIDLTLLRNSILVTENFLSENDLFGFQTEKTRHEGITTILDTLEQFNVQIHVYNTTTNVEIKNEIKTILTAHDRVLSLDLMRVPKFLDKVISKVDEFLSKYE